MELIHEIRFAQGYAEPDHLDILTCRKGTATRIGFKVFRRTSEEHRVAGTPLSFDLPDGSHLVGVYEYLQNEQGITKLNDVKDF